MDAANIIHSANEIDRLKKALEWLRTNGNSLSHRDKEGFSISVRLNYCSALVGAKEAELQLSAIVKLQIREIVEMSINDAINTIAYHAANLRKEIMSAGDE